MNAMKYALLTGAVLVFGIIGVASADDDLNTDADGTTYITDGRVNAWEVGAPAVIYCSFSDDEQTTFTGIEVLDVNAEDNGELAMWVSADAINLVSDTPATNTLIAEENGYSLYRLTNGDFQLFAPADAEGKVYSFTWARGAESC